MIRVRIAETDDQDRLVEFIRDHWSTTHVFVSHPEVFRWQHLDDNGRLNMVFAEDNGQAGRPVLGVLGFIPMGRFSADLGDADVMLAIWKVREDLAPPGLGLRLLKFLQSELSPRLIAAIGTSVMVRKIYKVLGYQVGTMHHSAIFNPERRGTLRIASGVPDAAFEEVSANTEVTPELTRLTATDVNELQGDVDKLTDGRLPAKDCAYVVCRYFEHPWYLYDVYAVRVGTDLVALAVIRPAKANGAMALRIVDVIGDTEWLRFGKSALQQLVLERQAEYVDLVQWGIDPPVLESAGFVASSPNVTLPNYFAPFEAKNIEIEFAYKSFGENELPVRLYRADADQDRPNLESELGRDS